MGDGEDELMVGGFQGLPKMLGGFQEPLMMLGGFQISPGGSEVGQC